MLHSSLYVFATAAPLILARHPAGRAGALSWWCNINVVPRCAGARPTWCNIIGAGRNLVGKHDLRKLLMTAMQSDMPRLAFARPPPQSSRTRLNGPL
jgi:hypothetical protein